MPQRMHKRMRTAVRALHNAGVAHGDLRLSNFLWDRKDIRLVDLGNAVITATKEQLKSERPSSKQSLDHDGHVLTLRSYSGKVLLNDLADALQIRNFPRRNLTVMRLSCRGVQWCAFATCSNPG